MYSLTVTYPMQSLYLGAASSNDAQNSISVYSIFNILYTMKFTVMPTAIYILILGATEQYLQFPNLTQDTILESVMIC
jgi:LPS O-antigen subunit length determinant protein (WzzB/FepE family)